MTPSKNARSAKLEARPRPIESTATERASLRWLGGRLLAGCLCTAGFVSSFAQTSSPTGTNCADPTTITSPQCQISTDQSQQQRSGTLRQDPNGISSSEAPRNPNFPQTYVDTAGSNARPANTVNPDLSPIGFAPDPITDFQRLARSSTGESLSIFGRDLFQNAPSTFAPADQIPVTSDYVVGPGDQVLLRLWGPESLNSQLTVDTSGSIYIPQVGAIHVAGLRYDELEKQVRTSIARIYRNFELSVNLGHLRSIQVYIVGEARRPGAYTISALSTVFNALLVSGGPNVQGSLRNIQVRRGNRPPAEFDLYDLVLHGDKSKDIRLEQGDTIFIPAAGPQIALAGSVRHPAIYELRGETSVPDVLQYAGGYTSTAAKDHISLERIDVDHSRKALSLAVDTEGRAMMLRDGDVLFVNHISQGYEKSVTLRGNLANPGRFPWHEGMRLSDIIPDRMSLLTNDYWIQRNRLGVPAPLFEPLAPAENQGRSSVQNAGGGNPYVTGYQDQLRNNQLNQDQLVSQSRATPKDLALQSTQLAPTGNSSNQVGQTTQAGGAAFAVDTGLGSTTTQQQQSRSAANVAGLRVAGAEIDWSYAVIERLDPNTLKSSLLPFNLGKLVENHDASQDLDLQPGDIVTILSQADVPVPLEEQTKFVRLEGEFVSSGFYSVGPHETLDQIVKRAGGLSPKAYLYGSSFFRESARVLQQQRLDEYISTLSADMDREIQVRAASSINGILDPAALEGQQRLIAQLRQLRATGRIVLEFQPTSISEDTIPKIEPENGDVFRVPSRPNTVSVVGAVYGQNVFLYNPDRRVEDYIALAGSPNRVADRKHSFIIRADGSIFSRELAKGIWSANSFNVTRLNPGDAIVVPEKLVKPTALRELLDYSQILSSFGIAAAAINVIR